MNDTVLIIGLFIIFLVCIIAVFLIVLNNDKKNDQFNLNMANNINEIKNSLNKDFLLFTNNINNQINDLSERMNSNIIQSHKATNEVFNNINERMIKIDEAQKGLNDLNNEVMSLHNILTDKKTRGTFGEIELYSLLEAAYGVNDEFYQRQYHLPNSTIADAVIFGGESLGILCVDSKFPLENYRRMYDENLDEQAKVLARKQFKDDVKKHINDIHDKYIIPNVTADMAYMFIPAEAIFSEIYSNFDELVELSYKLKVYLVSPTTLMAYITAIKSIYLGQKKDEKAKEIETLLNELAIEFNRYNERTLNLYKDYEKLGNDFKNLNITSSKIINRFNSINSGEIEDEE